MTSFNKPDELRNKIISYLERLKFEYTDENPHQDELHFIFQQKHLEEETSKIGVTILYRKEVNYRLEVVSSVNFSPSHIQVLQERSKSEIADMLYEINLFILPRETEVFIDLNQDEDFESAFYNVNNPLYDHELNIGTLERRMQKSINMAQLIRMIIQKHLNRFLQ